MAIFNSYVKLPEGKQFSTNRRVGHNLKSRRKLDITPKDAHDSNQQLTWGWWDLFFKRVVPSGYVKMAIENGYL